ncbi:preprotein translocase subunit YajC [Microbacterium album]|uniref:Preprotein translocase subunit YajC n=1 Tax=Microbacterium album TaxID=2053191 RepID=A0A917ID81_9MICO|nr:preprotein translocase subunit YajC [Microbacterium album]GGH35600.1 hypothetical protein GCM10010921_04110 [Microbacterium album]
MPMDLLLIVVLIALLIFMFVSSRRRQQKMREEQERKAELMVPGARIMTRSGMFGTLVSFDKEDLSKPAEVEIAPGVIVELHTQAVDLAPEESAPVADEETPEEELDEAAPDAREEDRADAGLEPPSAEGPDTDARSGDDKKD